MFGIQGEVASSICQDLKKLFPQFAGSDFIEIVQAFMRRSVSIPRRCESICGNCTSSITYRDQTLPATCCPQCGIEWHYILPCFLYFALGPLNGARPLKREDEQHCKELARNLKYVQSVGLASISPANRPDYSSTNIWHVIL